MATNTLKFNNRTVAQIKAPTGRASWHFDAGCPGLAVTVSPTGKRVFYYVGQIAGRSQRIKIGSFPGIGVDTARKAARGYAGDVAQGKAVLERGRAGRATIDDLFQHYLAVHAKPAKRTWERDVKEYERYIKPALGGKALAALRMDRLQEFLAGIEERNGKGPARKVRALLSKMLEVGIKAGWCETNPVRQTRRPEFEARLRYVKPDEMAAFFEAVNSLASQTARDFFLMCVFSGARRANVAAMRWADIDMASGVWVIPGRKAKGKKPLTVALSSHAIAVLNRRTRESEWVFPTWSKSGHYEWPRDAWRQVLEASGLQDLRIHDLRRSLGAWAQSGGANLKTISEVLGHSDTRVTAVFYSPVETAQIKSTVQQAADAMLAAAKRH